MRWSHVAAIGLAEAATKAAAAPTAYSGLPSDHAVQGVAAYAGKSADLAHDATRLVGRTWDDSKDHDFDYSEKPKHDDKPSLNIPINAPITDLVHVHDLINVPVNIEDNSCDGGHCADAPVTSCETGNCPGEAPAPPAPACNGPDCGGSGWEAPAPPAPVKEDAPDVNIPINAPLTDILHVHDLLNVPVNIEDNSCDGGYCRPAGYEDCPPECLDGSCPEWPMPPTGPIVPVVPVAPAPPPKCEGEGCGAPPPAENHPAPPQEVVTPPQVIDTPPQVIDTPPQVVEVPPTPPKEVEINHPAPPQPENPVAPPQVETPSTPPKEVTEQPAPECQGAECNPVAPPKSETPIVPEAEIPTTPETPKIETPEIETPEIKNPESPETPETEIPETKNPETPEIPETETPEIKTPETPEMETPETPEIKTPEAEIPAPPQVQNPTVPQVQTPTVPKVQVPTPTMAPNVPTPTQTSFVPITTASKQQPSASATPECEGEGCPPVCEGEVCEMSPPPSPPVMAGSGKNVPALALGAIAALFFLL
ncbi:hypothetical protein N3K66_004758 [Trichothecium roseum]|uniref:Uncharacterized protein n=1 Tax=Trichothecium roseum TaxID=47278 RepID=A0ACC0V3Z4_9HYPO|nr:hypothetical protein N3K66_004758 [Trichothecium roseum]